MCVHILSLYMCMHRHIYVMSRRDVQNVGKTVRNTLEIKPSLIHLYCRERYCVIFVVTGTIQD